MTTQSKMEYAKAVAKRYLVAKTRSQKTKILYEFCATSDYHHKHAIRKLRTINLKDLPRKK